MIYVLLFGQQMEVVKNVKVRTQARIGTDYYLLKMDIRTQTDKKETYKLKQPTCRKNYPKVLNKNKWKKQI